MRSLLVPTVLAVALVSIPRVTLANVCTGTNCGTEINGAPCFCTACLVTNPPASCIGPHGQPDTFCPFTASPPAATVAACCEETSQAQRQAACQSAGLQNDGTAGSPCGIVALPTNCPLLPSGSEIPLGCPVATAAAPQGCAATLACTYTKPGQGPHIGGVGTCAAIQSTPATGAGHLLGLGTALSMVGAGLAGAVGRRRRPC